MIPGNSVKHDLRSDRRCDATPHQSRSRARSGAPEPGRRHPIAGVLPRATIYSLLGCCRGSSLGRSARAPDQSRSWEDEGRSETVRGAECGPPATLLACLRHLQRPGTVEPLFSRHMLLNPGSRVARFQKKKKRRRFPPTLQAYAVSYGATRAVWSAS